MKLNEDLVSVIVPVYKGERFVRRCMNSLLSQTFSSIEIIVVYDESPDNTLQVLEEYGDKITLIKQGKTSPAIARNVGLRYAKGKFIAFCDIDDYFAPDKIEKQIDMMKRNYDAGLTYTDVIVMDDALENRTTHLVTPEWNKEYWLSNRFITFSSVVVRKDILDDMILTIGYCFDEKLPAFDDFDFLIQSSSITKFKRVPYFLTYLTIHSENLSRNVIKMDIIRAKIQLKHKMMWHFFHSVFVIIPRAYITSLIQVVTKR